MPEDDPQPFNIQFKNASRWQQFFLICLFGSGVVGAIIEVINTRQIRWWMWVVLVIVCIYLVQVFQKTASSNTEHDVEKKTLGLQDFIDIVQHSELEIEFTEVSKLVSEAQTLEERQAVMQIVRTQYPKFIASARHLQIVLESLDIMQRTKVRNTLDSRFALAQKNQQAMFDALPYPTDAEKRDSQMTTLQNMYDECVQTMNDKKTNN